MIFGEKQKIELKKSLSLHDRNQGFLMIEKWKFFII